MSPSQAELLSAARAGDSDAREELVTRHLDTVRAVCGSRLRSSHDVADATQETFLRAFARLDQVRDPDALDAWLRAIAVRACADHGRHQQRLVSVADPARDAATETPGPVEVVLADDEASRLHATLATLGTRDRQALWLRDAIGLPVAHVAADLGLTEGSARVLLARARQRLREAYRGVAGIAAVGLLRLRGRLTDPAPVDLRVALAAQLTIVAVAVGAAGVRTAPPVPPSASPSATAPAAATTTGTGATDDVTPAAIGSADARHRTATTQAAVRHPAASPPRAPVPAVAVGGPPPDGPSTFGVVATDGDGELAGIELWGGPADALAGDEPEPDAADDTDDSGDTDGDEGGLSVGPFDLDPAGLDEPR